MKMDLHYGYFPVIGEYLRPDLLSTIHRPFATKASLNNKPTFFL